MNRMSSWLAAKWQKFTSWLRPDKANNAQIARVGPQTKREGKIFVYGTLRRGQPHHHLLEKQVLSVEEATIPGKLYLLDDDSHIVIPGVDRVAGQLLTFADLDGAFSLFDGIKGRDPLRGDNFFRRVELLATTEDGAKHPCYVYICSEDKQAWFEKNSERIPSDWTRWERDEPLVAYYAYGSCMSEKDFSRTVPDFEVMGMAKLPGYQVAFTRYGASRKGGVADIVQVKGQAMEGVLFRFPQRFLKELDKREGVPKRVYKRIPVEVNYDGMKVRVWTYTVVEKAKEEIPPSQEYRDIIMDGARAVLSEGYAKKLEAKMDWLMGKGK